MKEIMTFRGIKPLSKYSRILAHEHMLVDGTHEAVTPVTDEEKDIFCGKVTMERLGVLRRNPYIVRDNLILEDEKDAVKEMAYLTKHKVGLVMDLTSLGLKRDIQKLQYISERIEQDLVIGTGFFVHDVLDDSDYPKTADEMAAYMLREIEVGIDGTDIRAGIIGEIGVSEQIYPVERESLLAAAAVHKKTGFPIYLHTYPWSEAGLEAARLLTSQGVAPQQICICHIDVTFDYNYLQKLLRDGYYIEFDNFGKEFFFEAREDAAFAGGPFATDVERVQMLRRLIDDGFGERVIIANDVCLKTGLHKYGGWGYDHIFENIIPMMHYMGFTAKEIRMIVDENPLCFLRGND